MKDEQNVGMFSRKPTPSGRGPVALIILDGFGLRHTEYGNAVEQANKPTYDNLWATYPHTTLKASEEAVGLPEGQFGNSEVGHSNIGAGRILYQELTRINKEIKEESFFENPVLTEAMQTAKKNNSKLHLLGLVSDGGVHSHINHLMALLRMAKEQGLTQVFVHAFMDGRDVGPKTGKSFMAAVLSEMEKLGVGKVATVSGRYYAMDRDHRWERVSKAYFAMVNGEGETALNPVTAIEDSYTRDVTDEFIVPTVITDEQGSPTAKIEDGDSVIMFNFRPDRAIEISQALANQDFDGFDRGEAFPHVHYVCMTKYSESVRGEIAYKPTNLNNTLGEVLANAGQTQLRIAETEKYPHVTFFFSGGREEVFPGEERILVPSPKVATYDLKPEMSAFEVAQNAAERIRSGDIDVMILNFANPDMVGHSGDLHATIKAVEAVDSALKTVTDAIFAMNGVALVTADHGNADIMIEADGGPCTTHTLSPVPLIVTLQDIELNSGILADLAPTMLYLLGIPQPPEMTGENIIVKHKRG